jgi:YebC/PmpR family DNA-binding regulatory protein
MAGHSKWANIQHRKNKQDAARGNVFTKILREINVAARRGGGDPAANPRLRLAMDKAFANNLPKDNIDRAVKKATGDLDGVSYEEVRYEGYAPGGVALIIECLTDNRVRTVSDVRHALSKHGGNLGTDGSVAFLFQQCGVLSYAPGTDEDRLTAAAIDAGADDIKSYDDASIDVLCAPDQYQVVKDAMEKSGHRPDAAEITMQAQLRITPTGDDAKAVAKILSRLEELDDVQNVYSNADLDDGAYQ